MAKNVLKSSTSNSQLELEKLIRKYEGIISFSGDFRMCGHPDNAKRAGGGVGCFVCVGTTLFDGTFIETYRWLFCISNTQA